MTYFGFLLCFLMPPLVILAAVTAWDLFRPNEQKINFSARAAVLAIGVHILLALVYTTPWDNYLVATHVWTYNPNLVSGRVIGWVPIEEYTFFILETLLVGLWWWFLRRKVSQPAGFHPAKTIRWLSLLAVSILWLGSMLVLIFGWKPGTYLALILAWALPAIVPQLAFGADILWHQRKQIALAVLPVFIYLSGTDAIAIASGTWTINAAQSTGIFVGGLPIEEALFFGVTAILIVFGLTLALSPFSQERWKGTASLFLQRRAPISSLYKDRSNARPNQANPEATKTNLPTSLNPRKRNTGRNYSFKDSNSKIGPH